MRKAIVYRHYDASGALLYVGMSANPFKRQEQHIGSVWGTQIVRIELEWCASVNEARLREALAIETEHPIHNRPPGRKRYVPG